MRSEIVSIVSFFMLIFIIITYLIQKQEEGFRNGIYEAECVVGDKIETLTIDDVDKIKGRNVLILKDKRFTKECSYRKIQQDDVNVIAIE